jgi:hypothetical protein
MVGQSWASTRTKSTRGADIRFGVIEVKGSPDRSRAGKYWRTNRFRAGPSHNAAIWLGPTNAGWMDRLLDAAPPSHEFARVTREGVAAQRWMEAYVV